MPLSRAIRSSKVVDLRSESRRPWESMMRESVKPFVVCKRGPGSFTFRPRGAKGWLQTGVWVALLLPLGLWLANHTGPNARAGDFIPALLLFGIGVLTWLAAGVWWLFAHAEVNDLSVVLRDKQRSRRRHDRQD